MLYVCSNCLCVVSDTVLGVPFATTDDHLNIIIFPSAITWFGMN